MASVALPRFLRVGGGTLSETRDLLESLGLTHPVIVSDPVLLERGLVARLVTALSPAIRPRIFAEAVTDPTESSVSRAVEFVKQGAHDCVVGFGGGSAIDTAKAVAVLARRGGSMRDLKAPHLENEPGLPIVAIPTTAGTGSEATRVTVVTDDTSNEKMLCIGQAYLPLAAVVDYELTLSKPKRLTADTGIDALTHAIEAYVSRRANPFTDGMAQAAMRAIWPNIVTAAEQPDNRSAREQMMLGALQAGIAFSNSSVALVHGMSRPLGALFHVPHGLSNAMLLPTVTKFSVGGAISRYATCARIMGLVEPAATDDYAVTVLLDQLGELNRRLEVPSLTEYGVDERRFRESIPTMAIHALASGSPQNNPRIPSIGEIATLYEAVWAGE